MSKKKSIVRGILFVVGVLVVAGAIVAYTFYNKIYANNVASHIEKPYYLYIKNNSTFDAVVDSLEASNILQNVESFKWVSEKKKYTGKVKGGRYKIAPGMSNNDIVNRLRIGEQEPINLTFNNIRTKQELSGKIAAQLEFDSLELLNLLNDKSFLKKQGFTAESVMTMFIPNTYQFYWNKSPKDFFGKMKQEYEKFWNKERLAKLKKIKMSKLEASILASIVQAEQSVHSDEKAKVAGVYMNRIKKGMLLESCPTLIFAMGDFTIQRVLNSDKEIESPYNTYKNAGLPPGPINLPEISSIDAVLNYAKHDYIFMCAKDDFSGYHSFSTNFRQHNIYAKRFQLALNRKGIKR